MSNLDDQARNILQKNDRGGYTVPTARLYPYQWNWDSAFVALGFLTFDRDRAWREVELLLEGQWQNGMIPSIIFRRDDPDYFPGPSVWQTQTACESVPPIPSTGISQPPVLASIVLTMVQSGNEDDERRAKAIFDQVLKSHRWYQNERLSSVSNGVITVHPWETGRDNCPDWEPGLETMDIDPKLPHYERQDTRHANPEQRPSKEQYDKFISMVKYGREQNWNQKKITADGPFRMADPGIHFILLRAHRDLLTLAKLLKQTDAITEIETFVANGVSATDYFWNSAVGAFTARNIVNGEFSNGVTSASALCFYADAGTENQRSKTIDNLMRISDKVRYMLPSWDPDAQGFDPQRYWCGPVWPQMNYIISRGLEEQGYDILADKIRRDLLSLIEQSGFRECFNPLSGEGCLGDDFSWTAAIWLTLTSSNKPSSNKPSSGKQEMAA